jgi:hypothetical protein
MAVRHFDSNTVVTFPPGVKVNRNCGTCNNSVREKLSLKCSVKRETVHPFSICRFYSKATS